MLFANAKALCYDLCYAMLLYCAVALSISSTYTRRSTCDRFLSLSISLRTALTFRSESEEDALHSAA